MKDEQKVYYKRKSKGKEPYKEKVKRFGKTHGDNIWFFLAYNFIAMLIFFFFALRFDIFNQNIISIPEIFSEAMKDLIVDLLIFSIISNVFGWIVGYYLVKLGFLLIMKEDIKSLGEMSRGINKFPLFSLSYYISVVLSAFIIAFGLLPIFAEIVFDESSLFALVVIYFVIKILIYLISKSLIEAFF